MDVECFITEFNAAFRKEVTATSITAKKGRSGTFSIYIGKRDAQFDAMTGKCKCGALRQERFVARAMSEGTQRAGAFLQRGETHSMNTPSRL